MKYLVLLIGILILTSCTVKPKAINYGEDQCHFCKMGVVDKQHAAQAVTKKGKVFMFDAIECMVGYLNDKKEEDYAFLLVNDYQNPGELIDAESSFFIQSKAIPSPMGAFLSALNNKNAVNTLQTEKGGEVYDWKGVKQVLRK
ncbi:MAG: nitrous oxide reductase accessory protein NosL [Saprospiraceae bacterium]